TAREMSVRASIGTSDTHHRRIKNAPPSSTAAPAARTTVLSTPLTHCDRATGGGAMGGGMVRLSSALAALRASHAAVHELPTAETTPPAASSPEPVLDGAMSTTFEPSTVENLFVVVPAAAAL